MNVRKVRGSSDAQAVQTMALTVRKLGLRSPFLSNRRNNRGFPPDHRAIDPTEIKTRGSILAFASLGVARRSSYGRCCSRRSRQRYIRSSARSTRRCSEANLVLTGDWRTWYTEWGTIMIVETPDMRMIRSWSSQNSHSLR